MLCLNNGGWMEQSTALLNDLKEVMNEQHEALSEGMSYENFQIDRGQKFKEAYATMQLTNFRISKWF